MTAPPSGSSGPVLAGNDRALFASDVHLSEHEPATAAFFLDALARHAPQASDLFLLGDLFDAWVGDDHDDPVARPLVALLRAHVDAGRRVWLMRGNRDFLLDTGHPTFSDRIGSAMLPDGCVADFFGEPVLLMHGDTLCTDDLDYQRMRVQMRDPAWQQDTLAQPVAARLELARRLRAESEHEKQAKSGMLMDANPGEVLRVMREAGVRRLVHGHTHLPAQHRLDDDGVTRQRWVLPDWDAASGRGGFFVVDRDGWRTQAP